MFIQSDTNNALIILLKTLRRPLNELSGYFGSFTHIANEMKIKKRDGNCEILAIFLSYLCGV